MTPSVKDRPRIVARATTLALLGSVLTVAIAFDQAYELQGSAMRASVDSAIEWLGAGNAVTADAVMRLLRIASLVSALLAAAAGVLAVHARRGSNQSRIGLTVLAVPMTGSAFFGGSLTALAVPIGAGMLWSASSRAWFEGREASAAPVAPPLAVPPPVGAAWPTLAPPAPGVSARPPSVTVASVIALVGSGVAALGALVVGPTAAQMLHDASLRAQFSQRALEYHLRLSDPDITHWSRLAIIGAIVIGVLAVLAIGAAVATLAGSRTGRIALLVLSVLTGVIGVAAIGSFVSVLWVAASLAVTALLLRADAAAWFAAKGRP